jgi:hypothetical protein
VSGKARLNVAAEIGRCSHPIPKRLSHTPISRTFVPEASPRDQRAGYPLSDHVRERRTVTDLAINGKMMTFSESVDRQSDSGVMPAQGLNLRACQSGERSYSFQ